MSPRDALQDLALLVRSGHQLIHLDTDEEDRASALLGYLAAQLDQPLFTWTRIRGLSRVDLPGAVYDTDNPAKAFRHVAASQMAALYHFRDLGPHLIIRDPMDGSSAHDGTSPQRIRPIRMPRRSEATTGASCVGAML